MNQYLTGENIWAESEKGRFCLLMKEKYKIKNQNKRVLSAKRSVSPDGNVSGEPQGMKRRTLRV